MTVQRHIEVPTEGEVSRIPVALSDRAYDILIQDSLLDGVGDRLAAFHAGQSAVVLTNSTVRRLYGTRVKRSLCRAGFKTVTLIVPDNEQAKSLKWFSAVLDELVKRRCERSTWLVALGGGVIGDLGGFVASAYLRGIPLAQVPTTLVAQVDSSIGGKTGVNHRMGKNLIGAFYQPKLVLVDPAALCTLPARDYRAGMAEVIKYGVIGSEGFFEFLEAHMEKAMGLDPPVLRKILTCCCRTKAEVVAEDEREGDRRRILNFGHTLGHAVETLSGYRRYQHGEAVAIGMVWAAGLARCLGLAEIDVENRIRALVSCAGLPVERPPYRPAAVLRAMRQGKKASDKHIHFVLPTAIGKVVVQPVSEPDILMALRTASPRADRDGRVSRP